MSKTIDGFRSFFRPNHIRENFGISDAVAENNIPDPHVYIEVKAVGAGAEIKITINA
jgi:hypothetical protein